MAVVDEIANSSRCALHPVIHMTKGRKKRLKIYVQGPRGSIVADKVIRPLCFASCQQLRPAIYNGQMPRGIYTHSAWPNFLHFSLVRRTACSIAIAITRRGFGEVRASGQTQGRRVLIHVSLPYSLTSSAPSRPVVVVDNLHRVAVLRQYAVHGVQVHAGRHP